MGSGPSGTYYSAKGSYAIDHNGLIHSIEGNFVLGADGRPTRMKSGGHGQMNLQILEENGIRYEIVLEYANGVRLGNVPNHKNRAKSKGMGQTWFPRSWTTETVLDASRALHDHFSHSINGMKRDAKSEMKRLHISDASRLSQQTKLYKFRYKNVDLQAFVNRITGQVDSIFPAFEQKSSIIFSKGE